MNTNDSNSLIDESEIRAALSFLRVDRDDFGHGVRQRVKQPVVRPANTDDANLKDRGGLLRIAASVLPINLLGASATASHTSLAAMGVFQKAIATLVFPAISFLMIVVTIGSWFRINAAQKSQSLPEANMARMQESVNRWWRRYGWIATIVFVLTLVAPWVGWTTPLLLLFMASAIGTASLVATLGKARLVDRDVIGGNCIAMLGLLAQVSLGSANCNNTQLLDPHLITGTFFAGTAFLSFIVDPQWLGRYAKPKGSSRKNSLALAGFVCLMALIVLLLVAPKPLSIFFVVIALGLVLLLIHWGINRWPISQIVFRGVFFVIIAGVITFSGQTLWRPIGTSTLVQYAKSFEPNLTGYWSNWQVTDRWLQDQGIDYDHSAVQARWQQALGDPNHAYLLNHVVSTGLILPPEIIETERFKTRVQRLLSIRSAGTPISSIGLDEYIIAALAEEGALSNEQCDHLAGRFLATWRSLHDDRIQESLAVATTITNLLSLIDRSPAEAERKADVRRWLGEYQVITSRPFTRSGGFKLFSTTGSSNLLATDHAVRLMQHYETHDSVDVLALRVFLRPTWSDRQLMKTASARASVRQRLDQVPGIPQPSPWDYIRLNQSLWFAMLLVGLCIYATLGSPQILKEANVRK